MAIIRQTDTIPINGQRLRSYRRLTPSPNRPGRMMSQSELSAEAGVSRSYIAEIEKGIKQPRFLVARALATALNVGVDDLIS